MVEHNTIHRKLAKGRIRVLVAVSQRETEQGEKAVKQQRRR
jgi:hypothetical protein